MMAKRIKLKLNSQEIIKRMEDRIKWSIIDEISEKLRGMSRREINSEKDLGYKEAIIEVLDFLYERYMKKES